MLSNRCSHQQSALGQPLKKTCLNSHTIDTTFLYFVSRHKFNIKKKMFGFYSPVNELYNKTMKETGKQ